MNIEHLKNGDVVLHANKDDILELNYLQEFYGNDFDTDDVMFEFMGDFIANSDWGWVSPESISALTDAPILGITNEKDVVTEVYGFMDYAVISLQRQLLEHGQAVLIKG